jgi:hypothetical protein
LRDCAFYLTDEERQPGEAVLRDGLASEEAAARAITHLAEAH